MVHKLLEKYRQNICLETTLLQIVIFKGFHFLLDILGLHTSPIYIIHNKANDHLVSMRRSIT